MKIFYALIFCVCTISAFAQNNIVKDVKQETNGNYWFRSATINVRNYETKAGVLAHTFNDTTSLKGINKLPFPIHPIFLSVYIQSGKLAACTLWNNLAEYNVINEGMLLLPAKESEKEIDPKPEDNFSSPYSLSPLYTLTIEGNTATFTFPEIYGNSDYNFPLEGTLTIVLVKDEPYKNIL
ncbi:MAG TPA: hypothetical protein PKC55_07100 [Dysgonomonas sp.]|uniref:hypothetical protein n=1 Tax=unclassified Dysgonomonas TaxID=2630389 RepID=UPI0025BDC4C3|nr:MULTISPECIES: hypothetical protein [unclassified Dysgonomonas]HML64578.1 hypothetical protein [Dysgonomonas sp.]